MRNSGRNYDAHAAAGVVLDHLRVLGPTTVFKLKFTSAGLPRRVVAVLRM